MSIFIIECQYRHEQKQYIIMTSAQIKNGTNRNHNLAGRHAHLDHVFFSPKQCTYKIIPDKLHIIQITRPIDLLTAENPHPHPELKLLIIS
jgi:hypothetical protein